MSTPEENRIVLLLRGAFGGMLMGLANLVPGISGGTMLLSAGVYPEFIGAIAEVTTLRFKLRSLMLLASVVSMAALAILLFAGPVKDLVVTQRFIMYSVFIGLTLGGVPIVWKLAKPASKGLFVGAAAGFVVMAAMALGEPASSSAGPAYGLLFLGGLAGASAMILPGVSGGYLLLLLGQYVPILSAVSDFKNALLSSPRDYGLAWEAMKVGDPRWHRGRCRCRRGEQSSAISARALPPTDARALARPSGGSRRGVVAVPTVGTTRAGQHY